MANYSNTYKLQKKVTRLEKKYAELKGRFLKTGDINIFLDFDQDLYNLNDRILEAIANPQAIGSCDELFEMNEDISNLLREYNSLLHSA